MIQEVSTSHPLSAGHEQLAESTQEAMWQLFVAIGDFWQNVPSSDPYRARLLSFMRNRIDVEPLYRQYYQMAEEVIRELIATHGPDAQDAYKFLFTDVEANRTPPSTPLALTRQKVSNEFIALQLSLGGFRAFGGALNYCGYFGGANVPDEPAPYRSFGGGR